MAIKKKKASINVPFWITKAQYLNNVYDGGNWIRRGKFCNENEIDKNVK